MAGVSDVQETYTGGDTMRCACAIASAYTSADITGVNADRYGIAPPAFASVSGVLLANRVSSAPGSASIYKRFVRWLRRCRACCEGGPPSPQESGNNASKSLKKGTVKGRQTNRRFRKPLPKVFYTQRFPQTFDALTNLTKRTS